MKWFRWWWLLFLIPIALGVARLRFDADVLDLLPGNVPAVAGLKIYQRHFTNSRELIVTIQASDADVAKAAAKIIAEKLRAETNLVSDVTWQPPWLEHPEQTAELIAYLWLNQPPEVFEHFAERLTETNLPQLLVDTREQLASTLSPRDLAQLSYDPYGFTKLPENLTGMAANFGQGDEMFASPEGNFRIIFVKSRAELPGYRECTDWLNAIEKIVGDSMSRDVKIGFTGRPAFEAEISASMKHDIILSVGGTSVIIAILFWIAHRRFKPMLWLLVLLALILAATLALGGLIIGTVNVISMGFAAILLGLAVDYAVVHYQEALAQPQLSIPQIRRAIAPAIFWAATTTISAFLVLNFGGLPGLAQLGSLVGIGVALSACVMIFAFLPPLFPERMRIPAENIIEEEKSIVPAPLNPLRAKSILGVTIILVLLALIILYSGSPKMDTSADALQPRDSQAYASLTAIQKNLSRNSDPLWLIAAGSDERQVAQKLNVIHQVLENAVNNGVLSGYSSPDAFWPQPDAQLRNHATAQKILSKQSTLHAAAEAGGFAESALGLTDSILATWQRTMLTTNVFWPTNPLCTWIFEKLTVRETNQFYAVAFLFPGTNSASLARLETQLPPDRVWLSSWTLLGGTVLAEVQRNLWKLLLAMGGLILLSLWFAFRRPLEIGLSLGVLFLSGLILLVVMKFSGWSWNVLNLMALPLILGTGVDYSLFMQLALRRDGGDLDRAYRSVGRALLLCGGTAIAGFGMLGFSSNAGMASLGRVCASRYRMQHALV